MSPADEENTQQNKQEKPAKTAKAALTKVQSELKQAKIKAYESALKKMAEELAAAEAVFNKKSQEVQDFMDDHEHLYS